MCLSIKDERAAEQVMAATHDAVVYVKGGSRFTSSGRKVKPLTAAYASEVTGHAEKHIRNCLDLSQEGHQLSLQAWSLMLMAGMDPSPLEVLCNKVDGVFFKNPDVKIDGDNPETSLAAIFKELGDVGNVVLTNGRKLSPSGEAWSPREGESFDREIDDVIVALLRYKIIAHAVHDAEPRGEQ